MRKAFLVVGVIAMGGLTTIGTSTAGVQRCFGSVPDYNLAGGDDDLDLSDETEGQVVMGGPGDDSITGGSGNDKICAGEGTDAVYSETGRDKILGDDGRDYLNGEGGADLVKGAGGKDGGETTWRGGESFTARIDGSAGGDELYGGDGNDRISGETGRDTIRGNADVDRCYGGGQAGDDVRCERDLDL